MATRKKRGKPSKIDLLPDTIKTELNTLLRDGKLTQKAIVAKVNQLIEESGLDDTVKVSPSGVNRYSTQMETIGHDIRQAREMAELWVAKLGNKPTGEVSQLLMEMLRTQSFKLLVKANDDPNEVLDPKTIGELALSIQRLERAALLSIEKEKQIKKAFAEQAAEQIDQAATQIGLTVEGAELIKQTILGLA
jgi:uncharacterized protein DUF3486